MTGVLGYFKSPEHSFWNNQINHYPVATCHKCYQNKHHYLQNHLHLPYQKVAHKTTTDLLNTKCFIWRGVLTIFKKINKAST